MIGADDLTQIQADLLAMRGDNDVSVQLRRGSLTLAAQTMRIARMGGSSQGKESATAGEQRGRVVILGATTLDIQVDDRLTVSDVLYRVTFVRPNRTAATMAEAEQVE